MLKKIKIGMKLSLGFGFVLALTALVAFVGIYDLNSVQNGVEKADSVNLIARLLLETRRQEKNFIIMKDSAYIEEVRKEIETILEYSEITKNKFIKQINADQMDQVIKLTKNYENAFKTYAEVTEEKNALKEQMESHAADVLTQAEAIQMDQREQLEKMRLYHAEQMKNKNVMTDDIYVLFNYVFEAKNYELLMMDDKNSF